MFFDRLLKRLVQVTVLLAFMCLVLGAVAIGFCLFYVSHITQQHIINTAVLDNIQLTAYRSIKYQTDSSPTWTSIGHRTHPYGCAVSRNLLKSGKVKYGDVLLIPGFGFRIVNDSMGPRAMDAVDLWVNTYKEEKEVGVRKTAIVVLQENG